MSLEQQKEFNEKLSEYVEAINKRHDYQQLPLFPEDDFINLSQYELTNEDVDAFINEVNNSRKSSRQREVGFQYPFSHEEFKVIIDETFDKVSDLVALKGSEYAGDVDRLANFRRESIELDLPMETIWRVYASKHWSAITQYIKDLLGKKERVRTESIEGRCDDLIVYLLLFKAMIVERNNWV